MKASALLPSFKRVTHVLRAQRKDSRTTRKMKVSFPYSLLPAPDFQERCQFCHSGEDSTQVQWVVIEKQFLNDAGF